MTTADRTIEADLAKFAASTVLDDNAGRAMRRSIFDWTICAIAGRTEPVVEILHRKGLAEGGASQSTVVGGAKLPAARAALINGAAGHALDFDDTHFDHIGHTSAVVVPAALAVAQAQNRTLAEFVDAALIGSEAAIRVGTWLGREHYQIGFHQTATSGTFGAALAALRLLGASGSEIITGVGLASTRASGLKCQFGTMGKPLNAGIAAEAGVEAALWASAGLTSSDTGLSGTLGFSGTHHGQNNLSAFEELGAEWRVRDVSYKFHACCHGLHAMLEALSSVEIDPAAILGVSIETHPRWMTVCNKLMPSSGLEAKFSFVQVAAMRLMGIDTGTARSFRDDAVVNPHLAELRRRIRVIPNDKLGELQACVSVEMSDGDLKQVSHDLAERLPQEVLEAKLQAKGRALVGDTTADALWEAVHGNSLRTYLDLLGNTEAVDALRGAGRSF